MTDKTLVHLVYVHGFRGDDTTFQSFPLDLQRYLAARMPSRLDVRSSLYPTYKSVKPISFATKNFLEWLTTQPPGPVILLGHSMGGLLVADAATDPSNRGHKRIVGMIAFDCPYIGMHPHVVISGIASLFAKKDKADDKVGDRRGGMETERRMNEGEVGEEGVHMVNENVTDDWERFKRESRPQMSHSHSHSSSSSFHTALSDPPSPPPLPPRSSSPSLPSYSASTSSPSSPPPLPPRPHHPSSLASNSASTTSSYSLPSSSTMAHPLLRWAVKHSNEPFAASKRWIVEHFQFGICMFDPPGLKDRYTRLVAWDGLWVNYWTECLVRDSDDADDREGDEGTEGLALRRMSNSEKEKERSVADNDAALLESQMGSVLLDESIQRQEEEHKRLSSATLPSIVIEMEPASPAPTSSSSGRGSPAPHGPLTKAEIKERAKAQEKADKERDRIIKSAEKDRDKAAKQASKDREKALKAASKERERALKAAEKERKKRESESKKKDAKSEPTSRHFVVLPTGLGAVLGGGEKWEKVRIDGVEDEVAAHCGLFIRDQNLEYDALVERVGQRVLQWCERL